MALAPEEKLYNKVFVLCNLCEDECRYEPGDCWVDHGQCGVCRIWMCHDCLYEEGINFAGKRMCYKRKERIEKITSGGLNHLLRNLIQVNNYNTSNHAAIPPHILSACNSPRIDIASVWEGPWSHVSWQHEVHRSSSRQLKQRAPGLWLAVCIEGSRTSSSSSLIITEQKFTSEPASRESYQVSSDCEQAQADLPQTQQPLFERSRTAYFLKAV